MIGFQIGRWVVRILATTVFLPLIFPDTFLQPLEDRWIIADPPQKSDAIVTLGGGVPFRPVAAADLYNEGFAKRILISASPRRHPVESQRLESLDFVSPNAATAYQIMRKAGVPSSAIEILSNPSTSTYEEILQLQAWAKENGAVRILAPTNRFHSRRLAWTSARHLDCEIIITRATFLEPDKWWESSDHVRAFQLELVKLLFYKIAY